MLEKCQFCQILDIETTDVTAIPNKKCFDTLEYFKDSVRCRTLHNSNVKPINKLLNVTAA